MGEWTKFWFEGNMRHGYIENLDDWKKVVEAYEGHITLDRLLNGARSVTNRAPDLPPKFGFAIECDGDVTLADWAKEQGMYDVMARG